MAILLYMNRGHDMILVVCWLCLLVICGMSVVLVVCWFLTGCWLFVGNGCLLVGFLLFF